MDTSPDRSSFSEEAALPPFAILSLRRGYRHAAPPGLGIYRADGDWRTETANLARSPAA
jgi:hypothetical protein